MLTTTTTVDGLASLVRDKHRQEKRKRREEEEEEEEKRKRRKRNINYTIIEYV